MVWLSGALATACLAVGLLHAFRLFTLRSDLAGEAAHAVMCVAMAAMFVPWSGVVPDPVWAVAFVASGAWFAVVAVRAGTLGGDAGHHVVGSVAMLFMLVGGHAHGHGPEGEPGLASVAAIVLAGYFVWHVLRCADRVRACVGHSQDAVATPDGAVVVRQPLAVLRMPRTAAVGHVVSGVAMTGMLLGAV